MVEVWSRSRMSGANKWAAGNDCPPYLSCSAGSVLKPAMTTEHLSPSPLSYEASRGSMGMVSVTRPKHEGNRTSDLIDRHVSTG